MEGQGGRLSLHKQFINPGSSERGIPFWAWNCRLTRELLTEQIPYFESLGMGGFTIHSRTGMATPYLGTEYMELVSHCVNQAKESGLSVILYDEDRWPSGFGGGLITKEERFRARYLVFSQWPDGRMPEETEYLRKGRLDVRPWGGGRLLCCYRVHIENGLLKAFEIMDQLPPGPEKEDNIWYLHEERMHTDPWFNNQAYMDTLDPAAVEKLIQITYEPYRRYLGEAFGTTVKAMFTDEPQFIHKHFWQPEDPVKWAVLPYSDQFETRFRGIINTSFLSKIPELFWNRADRTDQSVRYQYHRLLLECFAEVYCDTLGQWCRDHGIALTGHVKGEGTLALQAGSVGEAMRNYRNFQIPGIDMLCDKREYTTAKQVQSVARQMGRDEVMSELYGVTGWDFDFIGHKLQGDWQAAMGVTLRVPHLAWASMEGEAKRDFPASIFYQSPWYTRYHHLETYFARINTVMKCGCPVVQVAVIHPIESFWLDYGAADDDGSSGKRLGQLERQFQELAQWLLFGGIDFDYLSEALLEQQNTAAGQGILTVGNMNYRVILVPGLHTLRSHTLQLLNSFQEGGGLIIFAGTIPRYIDGKKNCGVYELARSAVTVPYVRDEILNCLTPYRKLWIEFADRKANDKYLYQLKQTGEGYHLFLANGSVRSEWDKTNSDSETEYFEIIVCGTYCVEEWNGMNGMAEPVAAEYTVSEERQVPVTRIKCRLYAHDSLLLRLYRINGSVPEAFVAPVNPYRTECRGEHESADKRIKQYAGSSQDQVCGLAERLVPGITLPADRIYLSEPNVLLLDQAAYRLDSMPKQPKEEILRIENLIRKQLGYPLKTESFAQPWLPEAPVGSAKEHEAGSHRVELWYSFQSEAEFADAELAIEAPEEKEIWWNGVLCQKEDRGQYVDHAIRKLRLGDVRPGENHLYIRQPFHPRSNLECCYLLGNFGTGIDQGSSGRNKGEARLVRPVPAFRYGDLVTQGLTFYSGNVEYCSAVTLEPGTYILEVSEFAAPVLAVEMDGTALGIIAFAPYRLRLGELSGTHHFRITAYGNRFNTFGALHNCKAGETWIGPGAWRSSGADFTYGYQVRPAGILKAPVLYRINPPEKQPFRN